MQTPVRITLAAGLVAGIFLAGYMTHRQTGSVVAPASVRQVLYYTCPMHPQYKSDRPGEAPCCGMRLVPVYAGSQPGQADTSLPNGAIKIGSAQQQLIGVRTAEVERAPASYRLRVPGRIAVDDERLYRVVAATDGWIRQLGKNASGSFVKKGQFLASYYTQNLLAAAQTFVFALQTNAQVERGEATIGYQRTPTALNLQVALDSLRSLGMSEVQIEAIRQTRIAPSEVDLYSPVTGFVLTRNLSPTQRFDKGSEMYRIADISHVWVMADILEKDRRLVSPGAVATVRYQGREFQARMGDTLPQLDSQSRTLKTRFELDNPGYILGPDMFVDVELHVDMPAAITAPADAVIDTGRRKTVFVERGNGFFEPRLVETGWRIGDRVQVTSGLEPGERIVISGNFLIDSESRMQLAAASTGSSAQTDGAEKDPVCGMEVDSKAPGVLVSEHGGKTYHFCSSQCKKSFDANPGKYVTRKSLARDTNGEQGPA
jgi:membrane fusion protein, copper/silver efflux system